jgi:hypothetical protein
MSGGSELPDWVSYLQALAVPVIGAAITATGVWVAACQMLIAHERFEFDIFDKRYERRVSVYEATRKILQSVFVLDTIPDEEIKAYGLHTLDAQFLFDESLFSYLRELLQRITIFNEAESKLSDVEWVASSSNDERRPWEEIRESNLQWIIQQGDQATGFATRFAPFLVYKRIKRPWWLPWPVSLTQ